LDLVPALVELFTIDAPETGILSFEETTTPLYAVWAKPKDEITVAMMNSNNFLMLISCISVGLMNK